MSQRQDGPDEDVRVYSDEEIAEFLEADKAPPELAEWADQLSRDLEARGAELWFLPSYSPDLNPIEEAFSKIKALLRTAAARTEEDLLAAIWTALRAITPADARGYFTHSGYPPRLKLHHERCQYALPCLALGDRWDLAWSANE